MIFQKSITTKANTTKDNSIKTKIKITKGLLYKIEVYFPPGSSGLLGVRIYDNVECIYPTGYDEFFRGDSCLISFDDTYVFNVTPFEVYIETYNLDDLYDHEVIVRLGIITQDDMIRRYVPQPIAEVLQQILEQQVAVEQEFNESLLEDLQDLIKETETGD